MFTRGKSYQRLDGVEAFDTQNITFSPKKAPGTRKLLQKRIVIIAHLFILCFWVTIAVVIFRIRNEHCEVGFSYSPAWNERFFETRILENGGMPGPPYAGEPDESQDAAWRELEANSMFRLTERELDEIDPSQKLNAVKLPDGGYLGTLSVFHEIHCVKHLRQFLYYEYYFPPWPLADSKAKDLRIHLDHCLEVLRNGAICRADISPLTFIWNVQVPLPLINFTTTSTCVDWTRLDRWAARRQDSRLQDPGYLRHAVFGDVVKTGDQPDNLLEKLIPVAHLWGESPSVMLT